MNDEETKIISLFYGAIENYRKVLANNPIEIYQGLNGRGHDLKLIYRFADISSSGKQIVVHYIKREEYRRVVGYKTINYTKYPIHGETVRKDSDTVLKMPYQYQDASYLNPYYTRETEPCRYNIIISIFEPKHWPSDLIADIGKTYLRSIEEEENVKITQVKERLKKRHPKREFNNLYM